MTKKFAPRVSLGLGLVLLLGFASACSTDSESGGTTAAAGSASAGSGGSVSQGGKARGVAGNTGTAGGTAGGSENKAGSSNTGGASAAGATNAGCDTAGLTWKTARKTWYTSYPDPGSEECIKYNGCMWAGQFSACDDKKPEAWVSAHNIVAAFPDYEALSLHDLCLKSGNKTIVVTVLDTCGDDDCDGCCTQNKGNADELIDLESYTNDRFGIDDGPIQWADLGPTQGDGCN